MIRTTCMVSLLALTLGFLAAGCGGGSSGGGGAPVPIGTQTGKISIDLATLDVLVTEQPTNLPLVPSSMAAWAGIGTPLTFDLGIQNGYGRLLFNLKAVVTDLTGDPAAFATGDGMYDGKPFFYYGPNALDLAAQADGTITVDGLSAAVGTIELSFEFVNHKMLFGSESYYDGNLWAADSSGVGISTEIDINQFGNVGYASSSSGYSNPMGGCCSPDGRFLYYGCRNQPGIIIVDTTTMTPMMGADLTGNDNIRNDNSGLGSIGFTRSVTMSPDTNYLYVTLVTQGHLYENVTDSYETGIMTVELVQLARTTLAEIGRSVILDNVDEVMARNLTISSNGLLGALALKVYSPTYGNPVATVQGKFATVQLATMTATLRDVSAVGPEVQYATIAPDGSHAYFVVEDAGAVVLPGPGDNLLRRMNLSTSAIETVGTATSFALEDIKRMVFGPDGRLYVLSYNGFAIYDPATDTLSEPTVTGTNLYDIAFSADGANYYIMRSDDLVEAFDITTDTSVPSEATGSPEINCNDGFEEGHAFLCTPF
jgi:hypothetical protein